MMRPETPGGGAIAHTPELKKEEWGHRCVDMGMGL